MNKKIECHDCANEIVISDKHDEIEIEQIQYCPLCSSTNIEVIEKRS